jgi:hypothetical protein
MPPLAVVPGWLVPSDTELRDCHLIAWRALQETGGDRAGGIFAAVNWVTGGQRAPVTERTEPASKALAETEMWVAVGVRLGMPPAPDEWWVPFRVAPRPPVTDNRVWAAAVADTLGWLLGRPDAPPPTPLPRRPVPTVEQLVQEARAARPYGNWGPEERHAARAKAEVDVARYRRLAAYADGAVEARRSRP